ncbi:glycosyltransferase family 39 protein [Sphingomonas sp. M1A8_2b]
MFLAINHDNNHHFNSLWMQMWGLAASPLALRSLSIATGTLTILVAGAIGARRGVGHALVAALLFAVSPILVNYGSEARGYAPMLLAAMTMIWCVAGVLDDLPRISGRMTWGLGGLVALGLLSQLTMLFFVLAMAAWIAWVLARRLPIDEAIGSTVRLLLPSFGACVLVIG